jgi:hypothetical protein
MMAVESIWPLWMELNVGFDEHPVQMEAKEPVFPFKKPKYAVKDVET